MGHGKHSELGNLRSDLVDVLCAAVDSGERTVIVDLPGVTLMVAAGIGCLQTAADLLTERGTDLHLVCPANRSAARVLRLLGLHLVWRLHSDTPTAVAATEHQARL